ncbi:MAG: hypothetical protein NTX44_01795 [Ignavibacteriales bacterium]|nr:hypothetical protein [Ignavibacteriales bacterium]
MRAFFRLQILFIAFLSFCYSVKSLAQEKNYFFFHPVNYGSESTFNPISLIANGGFDELQSYWRSSALSDIPWKNGEKNVRYNIIAPFPQINKYGWHEFIFHEVIPGSFNMDNAQYFPNYTLHLIGGGMEYRKAVEWFDYYGYSVPSVWAIISTMGYHYINEIVENGDYQGPNVDPIADLLIFDPLGILLFSFDGVCRFFSSEVSLNDWNNQPAISFSPLGIHNTGQNFIMKYPLTASGKTSLLYHFGSFGELGLSLKTNNEDALSLGVGVTSRTVETTFNANGVPRNTITTGPRAGIYWDRNNSLMASLIASDNFRGLVLLNIYPGVFSIKSFSPGFFLLVGKGGTFTLGITASFLPVGISMNKP